MSLAKPDRRPGNPSFSSGPCPKRPGWSPDALRGALLGRSHRSAPGKARLARAIDLTRAILQVPDTHRIAIVPASDTGAVEMAMWSLLGPRPVTVLSWENFGKEWVTDARDHLKLPDVEVLSAPYGSLPDLAHLDFERDIVFTYNGTSSGVRVPSADFITTDRGGLTICDATSAAFAMPLDWDKLDVVTFSWQKVLGGEAAHGMLILGPRAVARLEGYQPPWPIPKLFRMTKDGTIMEGLFRGETINTPSLLCVEDYIDALTWAQDIGGLPALYRRVALNAAALQEWVDRTPWITNLAVDPATRSPTSVCLRVVESQLAGRAALDAAAFIKTLVKTLDAEGVAYDIDGHRSAPPSLRVWCGATVETADILALTEWLEWGHATLTMDRARAA